MKKLPLIDVDRALCLKFYYAANPADLEDSLGFCDVLMTIENRPERSYYGCRLDTASSLSLRAVFDSFSNEWHLVYWLHRKWNITRSFPGIRDGIRDLFEFLELNGYV